MDVDDVMGAMLLPKQAEAERKRQEALRYFEEVFVIRDPSADRWFEVEPKIARSGWPHVLLTYRGAFERYQRLGVAVYDGRGGGDG